MVAGGFGFAGVIVPLIRLNTDGTIDNTFDLDSSNAIGYHVALQTNGKILLSGFFSVFNNEPNRNVVRLNTDGSPDSSFTAPRFSNFASVTAFAQQSDNKTVVAGNFNLANGVLRPSVARFNVDGTLDTTFNSGEGTSQYQTSLGNIINDVAIQTDGKIIIAGDFGGYNGQAQRSIARLNTDGTVDTSFNSPFFSYYDAIIYDILILPDGRILIGGILTDFNQNATNFLVLLNPNGSINNTFTDNTNNVVRTIVRQPNGQILIGGSFSSISGQSRNRVARLNADGTLDTTFNPGTGFNGTVLDLALQPDGKVIAAGTFTMFNGVAKNRLMRLNADGSFDTSFDVGSGANNTISSITLQPDGKIIIGGTFSAYNSLMSNRIARLNANGSLDSGFASRFDNDLRFSVRRLLTQSDGRILVGGIFQTYNGVGRNSLLRLTSATALRRTPFDFDGDGKADVSVVRANGNNLTWYVLNSQTGFAGVQFGIATDKLAPADFDSDGRTDIAVFRDGNWYILQSSDNAFKSFQFGQTGDAPVPADFTGDGRAELAVFRSGNWYTLDIANNKFQGTQFGTAGDKPVPADYDGDGKADIAVVRQSNNQSNWYILGTTRDYYGVQFGNDTDKLVPADYDGDGKTDEAVFRNGVWYILGSTQGFTGVQFGVATDTPVAADYDGDGRADVAVFRDGNWYMSRTTQGFGAVQFGAANDKPVPAIFVP